MHGDSHACSMGMAMRKAWGTVAAQAGDTHWEVGVAGPVARGLLSLVGVVVKGCAEEAGLHLVALPAHEVGAAGTGPVLHGAPGECPSSIFLSDCASPIPPLSPSLHLRAQRSLLPHHSVSTVKPGPHPSSNGPTTPILPCPHPHPCVPEPCWAVLRGLTGCCRLPRSHRSMAGSPLHHSSGPRTQAAVRWERWGVGVGPAQPRGMPWGWGEPRQWSTVWGWGTYHALAAGAPGHEALAVAVPADGITGGAARHRAPWVTPARCPAHRHTHGGCHTALPPTTAPSAPSDVQPAAPWPALLAPCP